MLSKIWQAIEQAPRIAIFRHVHPDMDAIGSQMGLKEAILSIFPDKEVFALGNETANGAQLDQLEDEALKGCLGILLDTSNGARIDDSRYLNLENTVRLDHHVKVEDLAQLDFVNDKASATAEVLVDLLETNGQSISPEAAQWLYQALTADNARYTTGNTTPQSLRAGAWLLEQGADVIKTDMANHSTTLEEFNYSTLVRQKSTAKGKFLFSVMNQTDYLQAGLSMSRAKEKVFCLAGISDIEVWALFTEQETAGTYAASLRARTVEVRDIAEEFGGGGHKCAAGIKDLSSSQVAELIEKLAIRATNRQD